MASNRNIETLSTGYDVQVIGDHPPQLNCGICTLIIKHAMHGCTKHAFCKECIIKYVECGIRTDGNVTCPGGCNIIIYPSKLEPNHFADRMVNTLRTKCSNDNCPWQGDLLDFVQVHQTKCDYATQLCGNNGCIANYLKKDAEQHNEVCLFKTIQCSYCNTDVIRMNKDTHEIQCLNERVKCKFYDIGCKKPLCRKDMYKHDESHQVQHMVLIYQNLSYQNNKISILKQQNIISTNEIAILKQENATTNDENILLMKKLKELEIKSSQEVAQLQHEFQDLKRENDQLLGKMKSRDNNKPQELAKIKLKLKVFDMQCLKDELSVARDIDGKVSLVNNDQVMIVEPKGKFFDLDIKKLSQCYTNDKFDYLFDLYDLNHLKDLMVELIDNIPYHWYESEYDGLYFTLVFPLDLNNIKDMDILIPGRCRITIINKKLMVEEQKKQWDIQILDFFTGGYHIRLRCDSKYDLQQLHTFASRDNFLFAGYACLQCY